MDTTTTAQYDVIIIGGGFYGCSLALHLSKSNNRVLIVEKESDLLQRASLNNQARVHQGYHYPRSYITAARSRLNYRRFTQEYKDCIDNSFEKLYGIAQRGSKVSAWQFNRFCKDIGAPIKIASNKVKKLFNPDLLEEVFSVEEVAFDAFKLKNMLKEQISSRHITISYKSEVYKINRQVDSIIGVTLTSGQQIAARTVFNCTYSHINQLLEQSQLPTLPIKYELTEMSLVQMPDELVGYGITIMDGPFFSAMPYPSKNLHSLSHVRYTPHTSWTSPHNRSTSSRNQASSQTNYQYMIHDASRYIPSMQQANYKESFYETKAILQQHEIDDGRPILFRNNYGIENFAVIMGGKIDNIYDILSTIDREIGKSQ